MALRNTVQTSFVAGLVLIAPLVVTLYLFQLLVGTLLSAVDPVVQESNLEQYTAELIAQAIAVVSVATAIVLIGFLAQRKHGQRLFGSLGRLIAVVPVIRTVYATVRQISSSFTSGETAYDSLVLVEFPRRGVYAVGLVTSESPTAVVDVAEEPVRNVFLPSSPNPAGGRLLFVPESQIHEVDLSVREGLGLLMTTGAGSDQTAALPPSPVELSPAKAVSTVETPTSEPASGTQSEKATADTTAADDDPTAEPETDADKTESDDPSAGGRSDQ
jgi:Uncharacterized conserved protein